MIFSNQFETFDPLLGDVPYSPFSYLPEIASRARALLGGHKPEQIVSIARRVNQELDNYFRDIKDLEIIRLKELATPVDESRECLHDEDNLDIPTWANTSEVDALKDVFEKRYGFNYFLTGKSETEGYPEGKDYEFFAVLSLWLLADALKFLQHKGTVIRKGFSVQMMTNPHNLSVAGEYALKAMDAVCYAGHLKEADWLVVYTKKKGEAERNRMLHKKTDEQNEIIKQVKTQHSIKMNTARHRKTHEAKALVLEEWEKDRSKFPSAAKAGNHLAPWLAAQGFPYEPRTITDWIRLYANEIGVKFR